MGAVDIKPGGNPRRIGKPLSQREQMVLQLIQQGIISPVEIAERLGVERGHARVILCKMRKKGLPVPNLRTGLPMYLEPITVVVARDVFDGVRAYAQSRGMSTTTVIQRMIRLIAQENLFDAIIDDDKA